MLNFSDWVKKENLNLPVVAEEKMRNYGKCTYPANTKQLNVEYPPQALAAHNPDILAKMNQGNCTGTGSHKKGGKHKKSKKKG
jgi:hypothetical protein